MARFVRCEFRWKGKRAFAMGVFAGLFLSITALTSGVPPIVLAIFSFAMMFTLSVILYLILAAINWPQSTRGFDVYDLHRLVSGCALCSGILGLGYELLPRLTVPFGVGTLFMGALACIMIASSWLLVFALIEVSKD